MRRIATIPLVMCAAPAYLEKRGRPEAPEELPGHDCLIYIPDPRAHEWTFYAEDGSLYAVHVKGKFHLNDDHTHRQAAVDGLGILRMPKLFVQDAIDRGDLVQLWPDDLAPSATLAVVYPSRHEVPAKVRAFIEFMTGL